MIEVNEVINKYFDEMYKNIDSNILLDEEQRKAITAEDDKVLIIAGAGTGKTTTMAAKVKYLVDIKKVDPSKILVMSYTKKSTMELEEIIVDKFGIDAHVTTFHSLGFEYIRQIFKDKLCYILDTNEKEQIFYDYFCEIFKNKKLLEDIIENFSSYLPKNRIFSKYFFENYPKYETYPEFFNSYKEYKQLEAKNIGLKKVVDHWIYKRINSDVIITLKGEVVKSASEAVIANFLFTHGIEYTYEEVYSEIMDDYKTYKPDFTLDLAGEKVYLEYFGLDNPKYEKIKKNKIEFHKTNNPDRFIYLDSTPISKIEDELNTRLLNKGFVYKNKTLEEIYDQILNNNKLSNIFWFKNFLFDMIDVIKENPNREEVAKHITNHIKKMPANEIKQALFHKDIIVDFYKYYFNKSFTAEKYGFDYSDLIYYSNKYLNKLNNKNSNIYLYNY